MSFDMSGRRRRPEAPRVIRASSHARGAALLIGSLALASAASAPPALAWTEEAGRGLAIVTLSAKDLSDRYDGGGRRRGGPNAGALELSPYIAYGLTPWLTGILQPRLTLGRAGGDTNLGFSDSDFGARIRLWRSDASVLSFQALARTPAAPTSLGQRGWGSDLRFVAGRDLQIGSLGGYAALSAGRRFFSDRPDEWRADLALGLRPAEGWLLIGESVNLAQHGAAGWRSLVQVSVVRDVVPGWSVQAGAWTTIAGRSYPAETGGLIGLWRRF